MPRKDHATPGDAMARIVLTSPPAKPKRTAKRSSSKAMHKRTRSGATTATINLSRNGALMLDVNDVLTKNDRYRLVKMGRRMGQAESVLAKAYKAAVAEAVGRISASEWVAFMGGMACACKGLYRLDIVSWWPTQRHHADGTHTANGDADAPVAMVKDALQHAGVIDDDMRIVVGSEVSVYEKGVRRTVAVLRPITAEAHAASVAAVLSVLG